MKFTSQFDDIRMGKQKPDSTLFFYTFELKLQVQVQVQVQVQESRMAEALSRH